MFPDMTNPLLAALMGAHYLNPPEGSAKPYAGAARYPHLELLGEAKGSGDEGGETSPQLIRGTAKPLPIYPGSAK